MYLKSTLRRSLKSAFVCIVGITPLLVSCDNEFDLSDINTDITVGGNIKIPIGETEQLTLSRIIDETDQLYVDKNGAYALTSDGNVQASITRIDEIHIKDFATDANVVYINPPISGSTVIPQLHFESDIETVLRLDAVQDIPAEVKRLDKLSVTKVNARVIVKLLTDDMLLKTKLKSLAMKSFTMQFPKEVIFADGIEGLDYSTNIYTLTSARNFDENCEMTETFPVVGLKNLPEIVNSEMRVVESIDCTGAITADAVNVSGNDFDGLRMEVMFDIPEFDVADMTGIVDTKFDVSPKVIDFGDLPDIVTDEDTKINVNTLSFCVTIDNPVGVPFDADLHLKALDANKQKINEEVTVNAKIDKAEGFNSSKKTNLFITNSESMVAPEGYVKVLATNLNKLVGQVPDFVEISADVVADKTQTHTISLGKSYATVIDYNIQMPFDFGEGSHIVYRESIDNLHSDIDDFADKVTSMEVYATVESTLPFEVKLSVTPIDINGRDMSDRIEYTPFVLISPGNESAPVQDVEMKFAEKVSGAFSDLDKVEFTVEGNTKSAVSVLKPSQYVKLKMSAHIPDGITITDN